MAQDCENLIEEMVGGADSGSVSLYLKISLTGKLFTISQYVQRLAKPGRDSPSRASKAPGVKASEHKK